jgi:hypothetical protein
VDVACGGATHRVLLRRGKLVLADHSLPAEAAAFALGAPPSPCFDVYRSWRSREQWEIALQPRGPGFHQLYRRPPLPKDLGVPLERGIARSWERRWARGEGLSGYVLKRALLGKAESSLETAFLGAVRRLDGGPVERLEIDVGPTAEARGSIDGRGSWLFVRVRPEWLREVGLTRRSLVDRSTFVVDVDPLTVVAWRADGAAWRAELVVRAGA